MNYILFDGPYRSNLLPFTYTKPVADLRIGILTIREKWERYMEATITTVTEDYLSDKYPMVEMEINVMINASFLPNDELVGLIKNLSEKQAILCQDEMIAFYTTEDQETVDFDEYAGPDGHPGQRSALDGLLAGSAPRRQEPPRGSAERGHAVDGPARGQCRVR